MGRYTSYYIYQKFEKRGEQDWIPAYPNTWSIDGEGTMSLSIKMENDPACGYVPPSEPIYRWNTISGYVCDECDPTKAMIHTSASTYYISGTGIITKSELNWGWVDNATDIVLTNGCTGIGNGTFSGLTNVDFVRMPNTVLSIGSTAFSGCSRMTQCQIPYGCQSIGASAFTDCTSLMFVDIPNTVTSIGAGAFANCLNFRYCSISSGLTAISEYCFANCDGLSDVELPSSITSIGDYAFQNCDGLYSLTCLATTPPTIGINVFQNASLNLKIYVPSDSVNAYKNAAGWSDYSSKINPIQ